jgi:hypothetical protein
MEIVSEKSVAELAAWAKSPEILSVFQAATWPCSRRENEGGRAWCLAQLFIASARGQRRRRLGRAIPRRLIVRRPWGSRWSKCSR